MDQHRNFRKNLSDIRAARQETMHEFSSELGVPKSTLQSVLADGQTSLDTALRISNALGIPLSTLTDGVLSSSKVEAFHCFLLSLSWYSRLSSDDQETVAGAIQRIAEVLQK